jgi:TRAP-type transport system periplasmic protein
MTLFGKVAALGLLAALAAPAAAQDVALRAHHFVPAKAFPNSRFMMPWSEKVQRESGGRIKIQIFPAMQLGGAPEQLIDQLRDGMIDIAFTVPGYTPGRFPRTEVFELPFVHTNALAAAQAMQDYYERHLREEYADYHVLLLFARDGAVVHVNRPITKLEDFRGLRIRAANRGGEVFLRGVGATAVESPALEVPQLLVNGVLDGALLPYEMTLPLKIHELVKNHVELAGPQPRIGTSVLLVAMNRKRYESLPPELRRVMDNNSGRHIAKWAGQAWTDVERPGIEAARAASNNLIKIPESEVERIREAVKPEIDRFLAELSQLGFDAAELYAEAQALVAKYSK